MEGEKKRLAMAGATGAIEEDFRQGLTSHSTRLNKVCAIFFCKSPNHSCCSMKVENYDVVSDQTKSASQIPPLFVGWTDIFVCVYGCMDFCVCLKVCKLNKHASVVHRIRPDRVSPTRIL